MDDPTVLQKPRPASTATLAPGARVGKYEIIKRIAIGGMAEIFLARVMDLPSVQKIVVLKRILPALGSQTEFVEMFLDEARIAATLQHPNIVQMHDVGVDGTDYFIAMEYLHGEDARTMIVAALKQNLRVPIEVAIKIVIDIAAGLQYAHEKRDFEGRPLKIVHRDVTPQNVLVTFDGNVKLVDFGIAKASNRLNETRFGTLKGKVGYMSPEQCMGVAVDRRSDIFSLGIMLFELSLCRRLFRGKSDFDILKQIVEEPIPRPTVVSPGYPPELERIALKALAKSPDTRYPTAKDLQHDLEEFVRTEQLAVSSATTQAFMERVFGPKLEAWREASTKGKSLLEILEEQATEVPIDLDDEEVEVLDQEEQSQLRRAEAERAELLRKLNEQRDRLRPYQDTTEPIDKLPTNNTAPLAVAVAGVIAAFVGFGAWKLRTNPPAMYSSPAPELAMPVAIAPTPAPAPSTITVTPLPPEPTPVAVAPTPPPVPTPSPKRRFAHARKAKPPVAASGKGRLVLGSTPWVNVNIDGADRGATPLAADLPAGTHKLVITNNEFHIKKTIQISIVPNQTLRKKLEF